MKLYHTTDRANLSSILKDGLKPNCLGIVYLSPKCEGWRKREPAEVLLEVETRDLNLTAFEDCSEWEVLCWGSIPPEDIKRHTGGR